MTEYMFGSGTLILKRTDVSYTQPALLGTLQDITVDIDRKLEGLLGQYNVAVALGGGEMKITGKAKFARLQATQWANAFFGSNMVAATSATPLSVLALPEAQTVGSGGSATVTNHSTFVEDLGVFTSQGVQLTPVASTPVAGLSYVPPAANAGVYEFSTGDSGTSYLIYYAYDVAQSGVQMALSNALMGTVPTFEMYLQNSYQGVATNYVTKTLTLKLNACSSSKLSLPFNNQKWVIQEMDFQAQADFSNNIGTWCLSE